MSILLEQILTYTAVFILILFVIIIYLRKQKRSSKKVESKIEKAKREGLFEPVSLHPVIDINHCIQTRACIAACPEKDILGIINGKATTINASLCIGHGACFHACPTKAITLYIGTESRGIDLPHVKSNFESNIPGIFIAGELGGMGLIKNSAEQGKQAVDNISKSLKKSHNAEYDLLIVGAGPAGIAASLKAKQNKLNFITVEQDTLGGTVFTFPRSKIVMTSAMNLPLYGKVKLFETSKSELLKLWNDALDKNDIKIKENTKVNAIVPENGNFRIETMQGQTFTSKYILLSIGRRGSPRKLNIPGEESEKVAYRLLEPENIKDKNILVVGGGDSAVEAALLLAKTNNVILSYRKQEFQRIKPMNRTHISDAMQQGKIDVRFNTNLIKIDKNEITLSYDKGEIININNDQVYIFAGGELPSQFLEKIGITSEKKFGEAILKHK